ncbi:glycogen debranching N-terminal domain-containing protein [Catenulispora pinisilvae]|uniref:glycogen debranching N-terminal domain-containing protein n=1 Tax=Catenulispora pinisilvae TaxID=2705253 RepID=UPI001890D2AC|nr:glycogen debranching N-terminal domain-containing protein [Catenulispora pinisilvae]
MIDAILTPACPHRDPGRRHHLTGHLTALRAPMVWLAPSEGDVCCGADGLYCADRRLLSQWRVSLDDRTLLPLEAQSFSSDGMRVVSYTPLPDGRSRDPQLTITRIRAVRSTRAIEQIKIENAGDTAFSCVLRLSASSDLATPGDVRAGEPGNSLPWGIEAGWATARADDGAGVTVQVPPGAAVARPNDDCVLQLCWELTIGPGAEWHTEITIRTIPAPRYTDRPDFPPTPAPLGAAWPARPSVRAADQRVPLLLTQSLGDLAALRMADPDGPGGDIFAAAGVPWYLSLFGRDSLWTARLTLALGTELAGGTLRTLARRQGTRFDAETGEGPGRILHEARPARVAAHWPPIYYGSIDATPLWVCTLVDAWRWGLPTEQVENLLDPLERALAWIIEYGDPGKGFQAYVGDPGTLVNQGWKDSAGAVRHADGRCPVGPIALCEVQGYAYEAAVGAAQVLKALGRDGTEYQAWADALSQRFRDRFWIADDVGRFPAIALDGDGAPVTGAASNVAHLIGTGILTEAEEDLVVARLSAPDLSDGNGLRAVSSTVTGYNPLSYHGGSIWTHDTAIAIRALTRARRTTHDALAAQLAAGLLAAGGAFRYRMPELFGGHRAVPGRPVVPYPAACPVQAWAAAFGPLLVTAALGLRVDVPAGVVQAEPPTAPLLGGFTIDGLCVAGQRVSGEIGADGGLIRFDVR